MAVAAAEIDEIRPGLVLFLDPEVLASSDRVTNTKDPRRFRSGPFVCLTAGEEESTWLPITTEERRERLLIPPEWRSGGHPQWLRDPQFLMDGANLRRGPHDAFIAASGAELTSREDRARVSAEGLSAINEEVATQVHRRDRA